MPTSGPGDHQLKRIVLPSGKTIEVVYFDHAAVEPEIHAAAAPAQAPADADRDLHLCINCGSHLAYPVRWEEAGPKSWNVKPSKFALSPPSTYWTRPLSISACVKLVAATPLSRIRPCSGPEKIV